MSTVERSSSHAGVLQRHVGFANELGAMAVLVGREQELAQAAASLATPGTVLSICGVAGSGKTALAVEAASRAAVAR
ncbi:MAG TPA: hypothetical protein VMU66_05520, partial [Gaiellales bacterium]|nr:hypothetical protein [Gaiellales bacterium]